MSHRIKSTLLHPSREQANNRSAHSTWLALCFDNTIYVWKDEQMKMDIFEVGI